MNGEHHLAGLGNAERASSLLVGDGLNRLQFQEVIAGPKRAKLRRAPLASTVAHIRRIGARQTASGFNGGKILTAAVSVVHGPRRAAGQGALNFDGRSPPLLAASAETGGHVPEQLIHDLRQFALHRAFVQVRAQQAHAAVYVKSHAARRDHAVLHPHRRDAADGKAVAPVDIRHGERVPHDAGQRCHVGDLLDRHVAGHRVDHGCVSIDHPRNAHARHVIHWQFPAHGILLPQHRTPVLRRVLAHQISPA